MQIKRDFELVFDPQEYIDFHGERFERLLDRPKVRDDFEQVLNADVKLFEPVACYDSYRINNCLHDRFELQDGTRIGGGPVMEVLRGAEELIVAVCSIGPAVDEKVRDYQGQKDHFKAMMLDEVASWAVDQVRQRLYQFLEAELQAKNWRVSTMLSPGESAWSVDDQRVIFKILNTSKIGVRLTDSCLMIPLKSLSMIMGIGSQPMGVEGLTNCDFCSMQEKCRYYQVRAGVKG
jgi:hypothetical protein